ncbi:MAG: hypothetical protein WKF83_13600 [Nocardioidaceae bacterium]
MSEQDATALEQDRHATLNRLLFPGPTEDFACSRTTHGDVSVLPTMGFLYGLAADEDTEVGARGGQDPHPRARGHR